VSRVQLAIAANGYLNEPGALGAIKTGDGRLRWPRSSMSFWRPAGQCGRCSWRPLLPDLSLRKGNVEATRFTSLSSGAAGTWLEQLRWGVLEEGLPCQA